MKNKVLVSILIPTYNRPSYLKECIDSVLFQKWFWNNDLEFIISDNSSNEDSKKIVESYINDNPEKKIVYNKNNKNLWMVWNWNKLLELKSWEYFIFLSDDDKFYDEKSLNILYNSIKKYGTHICNWIRVYIDALWNQINSLIDTNISLLNWKDKNFIELKSELLWNSIWFWWVLYKSSNILFSYNVNESADYDFNLRYLNLFGKWLVINEKIFLYRIHNTQLNNSVSIIRLLKQYNNVYNNLKLKSIYLKYFLLFRFAAWRIYSILLWKYWYRLLSYIKKVTLK